MIHIYKSGGPWKSGDKEYTIKAIELNDKAAYMGNGWVDSLDKVKAKAKPKKVSRDDNKK